MSIDSQYRQALDAAVGRLADPDRVFPTAATMAAAEALSIDATSISLVTGEGRRVPLGASDDDAAHAESLQFTAGDGPCLHAIREDVVVDAPGPLLVRRWPMLAELWNEQTPFRSASSVPLRLTGHIRGALNMLFRHERGGADLDPLDVHLVALLIASDLDRWAGPPKSVIDTLLAGPQAGRRGEVWVAVGMVMGAGSLPGPDALDMMRSWAYSNDTTVDEAAARLVAGQLTASDVVS